MSDKVYINGRAAIHKGCKGKSVAFPDVCLCPPGPPAGPVPVPLVNTVKAQDLEGCAANVFIEGQPVAHAQSYFGRSTGNEVARSTGGGVITHVTQGKAYFATHSMNVMIGGFPAVRHLDLLTHNHAAKMPGNTPPAPWMCSMLATPGTAPKSTERDAAEGKDWLEIVMHDPDGSPLSGVRYRVTSPKGRVFEGSTPRDGKARFRRVAKGTCKIEWVSDLAQVSKGRKVLSGSPASDEAATGATHEYVLNLEKVRVRLLDDSEEPLRNATCDVFIRPFRVKRQKTDGKGWIEVYCPVKAKYLDVRVVMPIESEKRRVHLVPLPREEKAAIGQRLRNLGFAGEDGIEADIVRFRCAYGIGDDEDLEKALGGVEATYRTADDPRKKDLDTLDEPTPDLSDVGERT